jgi:hypothetical protein
MEFAILLQFTPGSHQVVATADPPPPRVIPPSGKHSETKTDGRRELQTQTRCKIGTTRICHKEYFAMRVKMNRGSSVNDIEGA